MQEDEATVRLTKEEIQRHLDMTQRMPAEKPGLTHRPAGEGSEPVVALGLSLGDESEPIDWSAEVGRRPGSIRWNRGSTMPSRGPLVYIASMALIGLMGWMVLGLFGRRPGHRDSGKVD